MPTIADDHSGLAFPLVEEVVDCILDAGRVAPVVLRSDKDEGRMGRYFGGPALSVGMSVLIGRGDLGGYPGLVKKGEVPGGEVDEGESD